MSELTQNILLEQFLQCLPTDLAVKLRERKTTTAKEVAGWADDYDQAHRGEEQPVVLAPRGEASLPHKPFSKHKNGATGTRGSAGGYFRSRTNAKGELRCFECRS